MSSQWLTIAAVLGPILTGGGVLAYVKYFRSEAPRSDADIKLIEANTRKQDADTAAVIGEALGRALDQVRQLAADRKTENEDMAIRLGSVEQRMGRLEDFYTTGDHAIWDKDTATEARKVTPDWRDWPPFPRQDNR